MVGLLRSRPAVGWLIIAGGLLTIVLIGGGALYLYTSSPAYRGQVCGELITVDGFREVRTFDADAREGTAATYWFGPGGQDPLAVVHVRDLPLKPFDGGAVGVFDTVATAGGSVLGGDYGMSVWVLQLEEDQRANESLVSDLGLSAAEAADLAAGRSDVLLVQWKCFDR
jgi:hypothetical protein